MLNLMIGHWRSRERTKRAKKKRGGDDLEKNAKVANELSSHSIHSSGLVGERIRRCARKREERWRGGGRYLSTCGSHFSVHSNAGCEARLTDTLSLRDRQSRAFRNERLSRGKPRKEKCGNVAPGPSCKCSPMESRNAIRAAASPIANRVFLLFVVFVQRLVKTILFSRSFMFISGRCSIREIIISV